jgi:hypothetical protein
MLPGDNALERLRPSIEADSLLRRSVVQVVVGGVHVCLDVSENGLPILTREAHGREASRHGAATIVTPRRRGLPRPHRRDVAAQQARKAAERRGERLRR